MDVSWNTFCSAKRVESKRDYRAPLSTVKTLPGKVSPRKVGEKLEADARADCRACRVSGRDAAAVTTRT